MSEMHNMGIGFDGSASTDPYLEESKLKLFCDICKERKEDVEKHPISHSMPPLGVCPQCWEELTGEGE